MPRNGSGVMSWPPNTNGVPNTTVSSTRYNAFLADLLADLNAARPITAGGTGGTSAVSGNDNLNTTSTDMASAATLNLANATGVVVNVTGTTTITGLGTVSSGAVRILIFVGALTLAHNATSLILPGAANITTAAGDVAAFRSKGAGNWVCVAYQRATGGLTVNTLVQPTLTLKQSPAPVPTGEGQVEWDTDDNVLAIGDGAGTQLIVPIPASTAAGDTEYFSGPKTKARLAKGAALAIHRMDAAGNVPEWVSLGAAIAGLSYGAIGTYVLGYLYGTGITDNSTYAGSSIKASGVYSAAAAFSDDSNSASVGGVKGGTALSGTWRAMGRVNNDSGTNYNRQTLFLRVS